MSIQYADPAKKIALLAKSGAVVTSTSYASAKMNLTPADGEEDFNTYNAAQEPLDVGGYRIAPWGSNNLKPFALLELLARNNINRQLLRTKILFALGKMFTYKWELSDGELQRIPVDPGATITRFLNSRKLRQLMRSRATDYAIHGSVFAKIFLNKRLQVADIQHVDASWMRIAIRDRGGQQKYLECSDWVNPYTGQGANRNVRAWNIFDEHRPTRYYQSILHSRLYWSGDPYYGSQPWHGASSWIGYANRIPVWMSANINRSFNIKYHIEYPAGYFNYLNELYDDPKQRIAERERVLSAIDEMLAGAENAQSTFLTPFERDPVSGKSYAGWTITAIRNDLKDDAWVQSYEVSNVAMASAHGVPPSLANVLLHGKMPPSGSEKRISAQIFEAFYTQEAREIMVEPLEIMRDLNKWDPDIQFGFLQPNIVTLSQAAGGQQPPHIEREPDQITEPNTE